MFSSKASSAVLFALYLAASPAHAAEGNAQQRCESLKSLSTPEFQVKRSEWVSASQMPVGPTGTTIDVPAHCLFQVVVDPRPSGLEQLSYGTGIEMRLPQQWNGRLMMQGGGGMNGVLNPALGTVPGSTSALARGFAVVSSDGGHRGRSPLDSRFAVDQQARLDFAYQSVPRATREAKALVNRYYGRKPDYSYFMGCSTGGREAMMAAQRLPLEFDGVVAGNAAFNFTNLVVNQIWSLQAIAKIAPRDAAGKPHYARTFSDTQLQAVSAAVLKQCDALDGLADGMINDYKACKFDPAVVSCGAKGGADCLSVEQVEALRKVFGGARNSRGESLYGAFPWDTGISSAAWRGMHFGNAGAVPANGTLGADTLRNYVLTPAQPNLDPLQFDFDRDIARTMESAAITNAVATEHSTFAGRGGKMIVYHGLSDQGMAAEPLTKWYERLTPADAQGAQSWARLFLVPGMTHCGGGQATDQFDMLTAIQSWVEKGQAPERVVASGRAFPGKTRPLCPYPQVARYQGGNEAEHSSFACR
jgi:Tannase and feruloyl esterase